MDMCLNLLPVIFSKISEVINNYNLYEACTPLITVITTVVSLLIANIYLEKIKQKQNQVKTAKIIIAFAENKLKKIPKNMNLFVSDLSSVDTRKKSCLSKKDIHRLNTFIAIIQIDPITSSSLKNIGVFKNSDINHVINYIEWLSYWENRFSRFVDELGDSTKLQEGYILKIDVKIFIINSYLLIMVLSKIDNNNAGFNLYKDKLKEELNLTNEALKSELKKLQYWVDYYNNPESKDFYKEHIRDNNLKINELFMRLKELFKELGLSRELPEDLMSLTTKITDPH